MKLNIYLLLLLTVFSLTSCFEDDSNDDFVMKTPIVIDLNNQPANYVVKQFDRLKIAPLVYREGLPDADLSYKWEIRGKDLVREIGNKMVLDTVIIEPKAEGNYTILLTVTDNTTKISNFQTWELKVEGAFAPGIIVADTRDNGQTSDLHLLMSYNFSDITDYSHKSDVLISNICSAQGAPIEGKVLHIQNANSGNVRYVTVATDHGIRRYDADTYELQDENEQLFLIEPETEDYLVNCIGSNAMNRIEFMVMDGKFYTHSYGQNNRNWGYVITPGGFIPSYNVTQMMLLSNGFDVLGYAYDNLNHRFLEIRRNDDLRPLKNSGAFDPNDVGDKECLYLGEGMDGVVYAVMKDAQKSDKQYEIFSFPQFGSNARFNINSAENIDKALFWQSALFEYDEMFYATSKTIYSLGFRFGSCKARYTVPEGEVITSMRMWTDMQGYYASPDYYDPTMVMYNGNYGGDLLIVTTWNEAEQEGRLRCFTMTYMDGGLHTNLMEEYRGFGKILSWGSQKE